ncbi:TRAP transporter substrate-binding protein DctP [bacterium]|nr:TRAP transporter substrate-binding protein DctP [bacterium]
MRLIKFVLCASLLVFLFAGLESGVFAADHKLTLAYLPVKGTLYVEVTETYAKKVAEATNGRVEIVLNDSLIKGTLLAQSVRDNRVQMSTILAGYYSATNPEFGLAQLPGLMNNLEEFEKVFYGFWREDMNRILAEKYNCHVLVWGLFAPQSLISIKPIKKVSDFDGKKIRVHNIETATLVSAIGSKPTPMAASEVLPALQRGIIDGVFTSSAWAYGQAFYSVASNVAMWPISTILPFPIVINQDEWQKLPKELQDKMADAGRKLEQASFADYLNKMKDLPQKWASKGVDFYMVPDSEAKILFKPEYIRPVYSSFFERAEKAGLGGRSYVERAEGFLDKNLGY